MDMVWDIWDMVGNRRGWDNFVWDNFVFDFVVVLNNWLMVKESVVKKMMNTMTMKMMLLKVFL